MGASGFGAVDSISDVRKVVLGVTRIADAVKPALGPGGRAITVNMSNGLEFETRNGALIANGVKFTDPWSDAAGSLLKKAASYAELAGGGITNVALITQSLLKDCTKAIAAGIDGGELSRGIGMAAQAVMSELTAQAQLLKSGDQLAHVGKVAADGDDEIGDLVGQMLQRIEFPGIVTIMDKVGAKTELYCTPGRSRRFAEPFVPATSRWLNVVTTGLTQPGQVALIEVDGATPGNAEERRYRVESAFRAALAAMADGVVTGGGSALVHAGKVLGQLTGANSAQDMGIDFMRRAISTPLRQLVRNAGVDSSSVVRSLLRKDDVRVGYDVEKHGYADMYDTGLIDPLRATKNAVAGAASIASEFVGLPSTPRDLRRRHLRYFLPTDEFGAMGSGVGSLLEKSFGGGVGGGDRQTTFEQADVAQQPRRYLVGHFPDRVVLDKVETLTVEIAQILTDGVAAAINDLQVPEEGLRIDIVIECPGFALLTRDRSTIGLPPAGNSDLAAFRLKAVAADEHVIRVSAFNGGTPIGGLSIQVEVAAAAAEGGAGPGSQKTQKPTGSLKQEKGDVTLSIPATSDWMYWQDERTGPKEPVLPKKPLSDLKTYVEKKLLEIEDIVRKTYKVTPSLAEKALRDAGIDLWKELVPDGIKELFYRHHDEIEHLRIVSAGDLIPWEMLYPYRADPRFDHGFLCEQVHISRWVFGSLPPSTIKLKRADFVLPSKDLDEAKAEVGDLTTCLKRWCSGLQSDDIEEPEKLFKLFTGATVNLLHFACHNAADESGTRIMINKIPVAPVNFNSFENALTSDAMVFMNACGSDARIVQYTTISGWAKCFLLTGVGAFIGTQWEVRDKTAGEFARQLYSALVDSRLPFGEALQQARQNVRKAMPGDPTWLAYSFYGDSNARLGP